MPGSQKYKSTRKKPTAGVLPYSSPRVPEESLYLLQDYPEEGPENTLQTTKLPSKEIPEDLLERMKTCKMVRNLGKIVDTDTHRVSSQKTKMHA